MRLSHSPGRTRASLDDPNLVSHGGLVPVMALAERAGLPGLLAEHVRPGGGCGVNADLKVGCLVAGMVAGAGSIDDMGLLRHGAMDALFGGVRAPSTLGSHLRSYAWGNVLQTGRAGRELLARLCREAPLLPGADVLAFVDIDSTQKRVYGHKKQGARFGHTKIQGKSVLVRCLNALIAAVSTPLAAPVAAATRLRGGNAPSSRGAESLAAQAVGTARACGATGTIVVRMDSACYAAAVIAAVSRNGARFSVTAPVTAAIRAAIAAIPEDAWAAIAYPQAVWDDQLDCLVSDAEVAGTPYTAFTSKKKELHVAARLIVRRVRDKNPKAAPGQGELFPAWRYHAVFTDSLTSSSRPKSSTAATRSSSSCWPTSTTGPWPTCHRGSSPPTPPGSPSPPSPTTCCAPPAPSPAAATPRPGRPPSAATWSPSPPGPPVTAGPASPCTCPQAGTASASGATSSKPPAARPPQRPDQPRSGPHPRRREATRPSPPNAGPGQAAEPSAAGKTRPQSHH